MLIRPGVLKSPFGRHIIAAIAAGWVLNDLWDHSEDGDTLNVDFTNLAGPAGEAMIYIKAVTKQTSGGHAVRLSTDNGVSFYDGSTDYGTIVTSGVRTQVDTVTLHTTSTTASRHAICHIQGMNITGTHKIINAASYQNIGFLAASTAIVSGVRIHAHNGGNLTSGTIACLTRP